MSVYRLRYGTPEKTVPSAFAPKPLCAVSEEPPEEARRISFTLSHRGVLLTLPINPLIGIYGFGLQMKGFQCRGTKKYIRPNADPVANSGDSHAPVPFFVTTAGFGLYVDTARYATFYCGTARKENAPGTGGLSRLTSSLEELYAVQNTGKKTEMVIEIPEASGVDVYYITGENILSIVSQYNLLSGGGCLPPLWGLGCFYRCKTEFDQEKVLAMAKTFRQKHLPCDILGLEPGWQSQAYSCSYRWSEQRFPQPEKLLDQLRKEGFHVNLWEHAFTHPSAPIYKDLVPYSGDYLVWGGLVPDFATPEARRIFADFHRTLHNQGVSGFKLDECDGSDYTGSWTFPNCASFPSGMDGEQYHSLFGTLYAQVITEALNREPTLSEVRNLGALAASYPFVLYSDLYGHKDFLTALCNAGFSGLLWAPEVRHTKDAEDLIRRVQNVIFSPQALINAFYLDEMPWETHGCADRIRELFNLRMSLIPYLYTAFYDYRYEGKPPVRALVCDFEKDLRTHEIKDEYLFGDSLLVAPIIAPEKSRKVYLPEGRWFDFFTGQAYTGGLHEICTENIPVFVRENAVIPMAEPVEYITGRTCFEITLRIYGQKEGAVCRLAEDEGNGGRLLAFSADGPFPESRRYRLKGREYIG